MGRASKFSFPFPGRKPSTPTRDKETNTRPSTQNSNNLPKAQRILGTDSELNIDSPARDDDRSWGHPSSSSSISGMSISISESTRSINDGTSIAESHADRWELESGVLPRYQRLRGKPSSTLLGQNYGDEPGTDTSSAGRRMHHEKSSSTLKSFYDRQKSPLSVSQQTSASSARDLALRKGYPPVVSRSPLLQVDQIQYLDQHIAELDRRVEVSPARSRKKAGRLELTTIFPKSRRNENEEYSGPATAPPIGPPYPVPARQYIPPGPYSAHEDRRPQVPPKEPWQSLNRNAPPSNHSQLVTKRHTNDTLSELYDRYEQLELRSPGMVNIPESGVLEYDQPMRSPMRVYHELDGDPGISRKRGSLQSPGEPPMSWKNIRSSNMIKPPWESSSAASVSSRNTKTSRHTSASVLSSSNLKVDSVLALSSGSEDESSDHESSRHSAPPVSRATSHRSRDGHRQSTQSAGALPRTNGSRRASTQVRPSFTIPESHLPSTRISGPWSVPDLEDRQSTRSYSSDKRDKRTSKTPSSKRSSRYSTPPVSPVPPIPAEYRDDTSRSSRLMAVTEQEVALLEALRQKKARMREEIIEEHETTKTPPRTSRTKAPRRPETQPRAATDSRERILLYLDTPLSDEHLIDTSEPSPDLSDFLSFGSDEDSTPRSSWALLPNGQPRPDSSVSPNTRRRSSRKNKKKSPVTPPNAARLSAVGAVASFPNGRPPEPDSKTKLSNGAGVQLLDERRLANALLMDEQANGGVAWAM